MFIKNEFVINGDSIVIFYYKFVVIYQEAFEIFWG